MAASKKKKRIRHSTTDSETQENLPTGEDLDRAQRRVLDKYAQAEATKKAYERYILKGKKFLQDIIKSAKESNEGVVNVRDNEPVPIGTLLRDPKFALAFDGVPNEHTPRALVLFISQKCVHEAKGIGTAHGIRSAYKKFWENLDGNTYRGEWQQDPITRQWKGNPAKAAGVVDLMNALKHKKGADGDMRHHSRAMRYDHMCKIIEYSERTVPRPNIAVPADTESMKLMLKHLRLRAFISTAFIIWTRNDELIQLRRSDIEFGCKGPPPYHENHFQIHLSNRKGWQRKLDNDDFDQNRNIYGIYDQPDKHSINCYYHLLQYIYFLEAFYYKLEPDDYIFPSFSCNGTIQRGEHVTAAAIQLLIDEFVSKAGIEQLAKFRFTTHCFRRGGAQYRFMYAPFGERWPIEWIRWWGGWAERESTDTLMKYLIDDLQACENSHTDALCKAKPDPTKSLMSEHSLNEIVTVGELRSMYEALQQQMFTMHYDMMQQIHSSQQQILARLDGMTGNANSSAEQLPPAPYFHHGHAFQSSPSSTASSTVSSPLPPTSVRPLPLTPTPPAPPAQSSVYDLPPGLCIPDVPLRDLGHNKEHSVLDIVNQWDFRNKKLGLLEALKDWPKAWYTGQNRDRFHGKYQQRKRIALEFIDVHARDWESFTNAYPMWRDGHTAVYKEIMKVTALRKKPANDQTPQDTNQTSNDDNETESEESLL